MKFTVSYITKDGREVSGQIYTANNIQNLLLNLIEWGAHDIVIKSFEETK